MGILVAASIGRRHTDEFGNTHHCSRTMVLTDDVLSPDHAIGEFICKICMQLSDHPVYTHCTHVFCESCLDEWFQHKRSCPSCNASLSHDQVAPLQTANPLAWRLLGRVQLRCPLHAQSCTWKGDYSEVQAHLTSSESHLGSSSSLPGQKRNSKDEAEALKLQGNARFEARAWGDAIKLYSKAIDLAPTEAPFYSNRAAAYLMLKNYTQCITDCEAAIQRRPSFTKAHARLAKAHCELGEFGKAVDRLQTAVNNGTPGLDADHERCTQLLQWFEEGQAAYLNNDFVIAHTFFAHMLEKTDAATAQLWLARAELGLGRCDQVLRRTRDIVKADMNNSQAFAVRGRALFLTGDFDQAVKHLTQALKLDPDEAEAAQPLKRIKRVRASSTAAKDAAFKRKFDEARTLYTEAIEDCLNGQCSKQAPIMAQLHAERAKAFLRLKDFDSCLRDCSIAMYAQDDNIEASLTKSSALHALGRFEESLEDMQTLARLYHHDERVQSAYQRAQFEVRKQKRVDYYGLLGVSSISSEMEIKVAYKHLSLECHPDKLVELPENEQRLGQVKFQLMGEALEILTDSMRRKLYDEGYDKQAIEERVNAANKAAREHKKDGCSSGH